MQAFTQPLSFNERQLTNALITSLKLCLKWITGQNTSEWTKNHAHKHTIEYRRDTDVRVSHVPPLPSIYKVERRGWGRRENSNGFKFFLGASEAKTEEDRCKHKQTKTKTPAGISPHVTLHSPPTVIKGGGCMRRRDRISTRPSCSWCDFTVLAKKCKLVPLFFFF